MKKKYFILALTFLCILLGQKSFGQDMDPNALDPVVVENDYHEPDDYMDVYLVGSDEPNDYASAETEDEEDYNNTSSTASEETDPNQNIIDKPVITKAELSKLIQDLIKRYAVSTKDKYVLTTSNAKTYNGTVVRFYDRATGHSFYYFTPDTSGDLLKVGNYYKIPEPVSNGSTNTSSTTNSNMNVDYYGMPQGFQLIKTDSGNQSVYFGINDHEPEPYCQDCDRMETANDPKYPTFLRVLPKIKSLVLNNTKILNSLTQVSGYSVDQIKDLLTEDNLKKIFRVSNISTWGLFERDYTPKIIFIRTNLVASLETGGYKLGGSNQNLNDTSFFAAIVILHELVHYGRYWNNLPQRVMINNKTYEAGEIFETNIFGHVLAIDGATNLATQYGWTL